MSIKALQEYTRFSKYARYLPELKRRETWHEQVDRVIDMHREKFAPILNLIYQELDFVQQMMYQKRILGSQRALQFGGKPILSKSARMYNCTVSYVDRPRFFQEAMYVLLCGCGAGFSVQHHHIECLPLITKPTSKERKTFVIPDSIEGWADSIGVLLSSYFVSDQPFPEYAGHGVDFDYSMTCRVVSMRAGCFSKENRGQSTVLCYGAHMTNCKILITAERLLIHSIR